MINLKETGDYLAQALTTLANALSSTKIANLSHFCATRIIPFAKKDVTPRPVGVGDVSQRIVLKAIDRQHRDLVIQACPKQFGNGLRFGIEAIIHAIGEEFVNPNLFLLTVDSSNAFNSLSRSEALKSMAARVPSLYTAAYNFYGEESYAVAQDEIISVNLGTCQGCPLAASFFNIGISPMIEQLLEKYGNSLAWFMEDGFFIGTKAEVEDFWADVKSLGPKYGYFVNNKSKVYGKQTNVDTDSWTDIGVEFSSEGLEILGSPVGEESFVQKLTKMKFQ